ncbi:MAG TPA: VrrA/YqfQ family protein [Bacillus sp. (in: firmicutes)]|nr:VrrA/YqfQ family protein [Bacillus sp. (in: firmicutes)]
MLPRRPFPPIPPRRFPMQPFFQNQPMMNRPSGGLLSRLFGGRAHSMPNMQNTSRVGAMLSSVQNATNPSSISSMMTNVQKVLKAVETVGPMVQQYGPVVKNIPAMFKIYKALKSDDTSDEETAATMTENEEPDNGNSLDEDAFNELEAEFAETPLKGASKPRLYI